MDPAEVIAALRDIDERGDWLGAIVHSHPATSPVPSPTDLRQAHYPLALLVIVGLAGTSPETRAWRIETAIDPAGAVATEVPFVVDDGGDAGAERRTEERSSGGSMVDSAAGARPACSTA